MLFRTVPFPLSPDWKITTPAQNSNPIAIISGMGKATNFKFGQYIHRVQPNESSIKNFGAKGAWAYPGTVQFFGSPLLYHERVKLRTSNFVCTFMGSIGTKAHYKLREK